MTDDQPRAQGLLLTDSSDPLGLKAGIENAKKILANRKGKKLSAKANKEAEEVQSFALGLGLNGESFRRALATQGNNRETLEFDDSPDNTHMDGDGHASTNEHIPIDEQPPTNEHVPKTEHVTTSELLSTNERVSLDEHTPVNGHVSANEQPAGSDPNQPELHRHNTGRPDESGQSANTERLPNNGHASLQEQTSTSEHATTKEPSPTSEHAFNSGHAPISTEAAAIWPEDSPIGHITTTNSEGPTRGGDHNLALDAQPQDDALHLPSTDIPEGLPQSKGKDCGHVPTNAQDMRGHASTDVQDTREHVMTHAQDGREHASTSEHPSKPEQMTAPSVLPERGVYGHEPFGGHASTGGHHLTPERDGHTSYSMVTQALAGKRLSLCGTDVELLKFLIENDPVKMSLTELSTLSGIKFGTLRHCIARLQPQKYFETGQVMHGQLRKTVFALNPHKCMEFMQALRVNPFERSGHAPKYEHESNSGHMSILNPRENLEHMFTQEHAPKFEQNNPSLDRKIKENLSILENLEEEAKRLYQIDDETMQMLLPDLYQAGFTPINVRSLIKTRHENGLDLSGPTVKMIRMGMRHADAALRIGEGSFKGTVSTVVENIVSYTFSTLLRDASFPKPPGWEPEEVVAQRLETERLKQEAERLRLEAELKAEVQAREKADREEQDYQVWRTGLAAEDIAAFKNRCPNKKSDEALERFLRVEWRKTLG